MLRAAVQIGLFQAVLPTKKDPGVKFKNNKRSALLRDGHPNCLKNMVRFSASNIHHSQHAIEVLHLHFICRPVAMDVLMLASP